MHRSSRPKVRFGYSSSEDECKLNRDELRAALKRDITPINPKSTSKNYLKGVQKCVTKFIEIKSSEDKEEADVSASIEILELLDTLTDENLIRGNKSEIIKLSDDSEDESISLEEQELRLIALKSAILKKHEARKRRKLIAARPYSPTDTDILLDRNDEFHFMLKVKNDTENMEISPPASPQFEDKSLQQIDMDLDSDESGSSIHFANNNSSVFSEELWNNIPLPEDNKIENKILEMGTFNNITIAFSDSQKQIGNVTTDDICRAVEETKPVAKVNSVDCTQSQEEEENALRALLLAKLNSPKFTKKNYVTENPVMAKTNKIINDVALTDVSLEAEHLRQFLLLSINKKDDQKENCDNLATEKPLSKTQETVHMFKKCNAKKQISSDVCNEINLKTLNSNCEQVANSKHAFKQSFTKDAIENIENNFNFETNHKVTAKVSSAIVATNLNVSSPIMISDTSQKLSNINRKYLPKMNVNKQTFKRIRDQDDEIHTTNKNKQIALRKSKIITTLNPKIVKQMLIKLDNSDSDSDFIECCKIDSNYDTNRINDTASSASLTMDSLTHSSPSSPMSVTNSLNDFTSTNFQNVDIVPAISSLTKNVTPSNTFEKKLEDFLKSARIKVDKLKTSHLERNTIPINEGSATPATPLVSFFFL